ncbi:hypothetical protein BU24DRAFT_496404 [Aaosphaeria arxii CBS 175.79]|uniref:Uncharacterized protein n=1 Tax=Aaosphaeria arxii CBS 175.79 TaxID=1450172 RepID=A0A6A5XBW4_9PLEO|nr:uncharacterized protein BU24DRAFT_496404 [Aaosphaeria arxii CBS 175.79]KAF2010393.1 hypothetical protein BU24DRAFT_496404 [Aaosphaeria arxii CBS 175.79]
MKVFATLVGLIALACALPGGAFPGYPVGHVSNAVVSCGDCKARFENCVRIAGVKGTNGGGCEKICAKRACQLNNDICKGCDKDFLNCTGLNKYPHPTIVIKEDPEEGATAADGFGHSVNLLEYIYDESGTLTKLEG